MAWSYLTILFVFIGSLVFAVMELKLASTAHQFRETTMQLLLKSYQPQDIYNADETGIYFRALPGNTYVYESCKKTVRGFKTAQNHVTLMVACNMNGDKEDLLLIGKAGSPKCFENVKTLPIQYDFSTNAWMADKIYGSWLRSWDHRLQESGRQVVVLLDNCFSHVVIDDLKNITLKFLPPNTRSVLQPCDMGIIKTLKVYLRQEMHEKIIDVMEDTECDIFAKQFTILDAKYMLSVAWKEVSSQTIKHCWIKGGFVSAEESNEAIDVNKDLILPSLPTGLTKKQFENWLSVDDGAVVAPEIITEEEKLDEIIHDILQSQKETRREDGNSNVDERVPEPPTPVEMRCYLT